MANPTEVVKKYEFEHSHIRHQHTAVAALFCHEMMVNVMQLECLAAVSL